jgi:hypothetical protein
VSRRKRSWWEDTDDAVSVPSIQVHESDTKPTGLLDARGRKLVRPKGKLGF